MHDQKSGVFKLSCSTLVVIIHDLLAKNDRQPRSLGEFKLRGVTCFVHRFRSAVAKTDVTYRH